MPDKWAQTLNNLANAYSDRIRGERADNLERAIRAYEQALEVRTREAMPASWAQTFHNLAGAYTERIRGDRAENLERAIQYYQEALKVRTQEAMPAKWAQTLHSLAVAYVDRVDGDHAENIEQAIVHYRRALEVRTPEAGPVNWATTVLSLGEHTSTASVGSGQNIEEAITCTPHTRTGLRTAARQLRTGQDLLCSCPRDLRSRHSRPITG